MNVVSTPNKLTYRGDVLAELAPNGESLTVYMRGNMGKVRRLLFSQFFRKIGFDWIVEDDCFKQMPANRRANAYVPFSGIRNDPVKLARIYRATSERDENRLVRGLDLSNAYVGRVNMFRLSLPGFDLSNSRATEIYMQSVDCNDGAFANADMVLGTINESRFCGCNFKGARLTNASIGNCRFEACDFTHANLSECDLNFVHFVGCDFTATCFHYARSRGADFTDCTFELSTINSASYQIVEAVGAYTRQKRLEEVRRKQEEAEAKKTPDLNDAYRESSKSQQQRNAIRHVNAAGDFRAAFFDFIDTCAVVIGESEDSEHAAVRIISANRAYLSSEDVHSFIVSPMTQKESIVSVMTSTGGRRVFLMDTRGMRILLNASDTGALEMIPAKRSEE